MMCLLAGCSICWFNTVCFVLCIRNFPSNRALALSLTVSFNGLTAALYALIADSIDPSSSPKLYLLLNALIPLLTSILALTPLILQPSLQPLNPDAVQRDSIIFLILNILAVLTGIYLMLLSSSSYNAHTTRALLGGAMVLLVFPVFIPGIIVARAWFHQITAQARVRLERSGFILVGDDDLELYKGLISKEACVHENGLIHMVNENGSSYGLTRHAMEVAGREGCCETVIGQNQLAMLGEEHPWKVLVRRLDFWLYYVAYFCGGTIGLVYSNNLGQIAQSLGQGTETTTLVTVYAAFSFFGRLLSAAPDYVRA